MVVLNRIYTRTGDEGTTMLGNGEHRKKYDLRVDAYGTVDEVTAAIGVARLHTADAPAIDAMLARIQNDLFDLAADLCSPDKGKGPGGARLAVNAAQVKRLEDEIDTLNAELAPLRTFVLAGGSPAAAYLHLARTICRRAERVIVELKDFGRERFGGGDELHQPPVGFPVRGQPLPQRQGRARRVVGSGREPLKGIQWSFRSTTTIRSIEDPSRYVTWTLIALNIAIFLVQDSASDKTSTLLLVTTSRCSPRR